MEFKVTSVAEFPHISQVSVERSWALISELYSAKGDTGSWGHILPFADTWEWGRKSIIWIFQGQNVKVCLADAHLSRWFSPHIAVHPSVPALMLTDKHQLGHLVPSLDSEFLEARDFIWSLQSRLALKARSKNVCWMCKWMNKYMVLKAFPVSFPLWSNLYNNLAWCK